MTCLLVEDTEAELVTGCVPKHPEIAETEHALRRFGEGLPLRAECNSNPFQPTHQGQSQRLDVLDDISRQFDLTAIFRDHLTKRSFSAPKRQPVKYRNLTVVCQWLGKASWSFWKPSMSRKPFRGFESSGKTNEGMWLSVSLSSSL